MVLFREPTAWDRYKRYIVGSLSLMAAQTALIAGLLVQRARRRRAEQQLRDSQGKLRESYDRIRHLGRRLLGAQETERALIARELHDDINQRLALLSIELDSLRSSPQEVGHAKRLSRALEQAYKISTSVHELSRRLHPSILHMIGLVAAIDNLQRDFSRRDQIVVYTHRDVPDVIEHDIALCLFRVAQEALRNATKHSDARHLCVDLAGTDGSLALTITDDGKGFDVDRASSDGLGLTSMRERLESVGGVLEIQAMPGSGTRVKATVPIGAPTGAMMPT
jgi:signal transduction histidine kinase